MEFRQKLLNAYYDYDCEYEGHKSFKLREDGKIIETIPNLLKVFSILKITELSDDILYLNIGEYDTLTLNLYNKIYRNSKEVEPYTGEFDFLLPLYDLPFEYIIKNNTLVKVPRENGMEKKQEELQVTEEVNTNLESDTHINNYNQYSEEELEEFKDKLLKAYSQWAVVNFKLYDDYNKIIESVPNLLKILSILKILDLSNDSSLYDNPWYNTLSFIRDDVYRTAYGGNCYEGEFDFLLPLYDLPFEYVIQGDKLVKVHREDVVEGKQADLQPEEGLAVDLEQDIPVNGNKRYSDEELIPFKNKLICNYFGGESINFKVQDCDIIIESVPNLIKILSILKVRDLSENDFTIINTGLSTLTLELNGNTFITTYDSAAYKGEFDFLLSPYNLPFEYVIKDNKLVKVEREVDESINTKLEQIGELKSEQEQNKEQLKFDFLFEYFRTTELCKFYDKEFKEYLIRNCILDSVNNELADEIAGSEYKVYAVLNHKGDTKLFEIATLLDINVDDFARVAAEQMDIGIVFNDYEDGEFKGQLRLSWVEVEDGKVYNSETLEYKGDFDFLLTE